MKGGSMDIKGKYIMVTGANSGIGKATAAEIAHRGAHVIMVCRNRERGEAARKDIIAQTLSTTVDLMLADLTSLTDIKKLSGDYAKKYGKLHVLVNNAGGFFMKRHQTKEGIELTFSLNHLGYFRLTSLLLPVLKKSGNARIVNVSSDAHRYAPLDLEDLEMKEQKYRGFTAYSRSKIANILFTRELSRRLSGTGITVNAAHPGFVRSGFGKGNNTALNIMMGIAGFLFGVSPEKGARTSVYLATSDEVEGKSGGYYIDCKEAKPAEGALDDDAARILWEKSQAYM